MIGSFVLSAIALGLGLYWLAVFRPDRVRDPGAIRTAWLLLAASLPMAIVAEGMGHWIVWLPSWTLVAVSFVFVHFAVDPMFPSDSSRSRRRDEPRTPAKYEPIMTPPDDTSHIPIPPEVPQI
jgi:hypothetical protein